MNNDDTPAYQVATSVQAGGFASFLPRRGSTAILDHLKGDFGEVVVDVNAKTLRVCDGEQRAGYALAREPFISVRELLDSTETGWAKDTTIRAAGHMYQVVADGTAVLRTRAGIGLRPLRNEAGTFSVEAFGTTGDGETDDSTAFAAAFATALPGDTILVPRPRVAYIVGDVICPNRVSLVSPGFTRFYNIRNSEDLNGLPVIRKRDGAVSCVNFAGNSLVSGLIFDGVDKTCHGVSQDSKVTGMWFSCVSMQRFRRGFGTGYSLNNSRLFFCHANGNAVGIGNMIDSHVTNCEVNANHIGVEIQSGCNDTVYTGNKIEWNTTDGIRISGGNSSNQFLSGVIDRNGASGVTISGLAKCSFGDVKFRRNASRTPDGAHIHIQTSQGSIVTIANCSTATGVNDRQAKTRGARSPDYSLICDSADRLIITGGDFSGAAIAPMRINSEPAAIKQTSVGGVDDWVNTGLVKIRDGRRHYSRIEFGQVAEGASSLPCPIDLAPPETRPFRAVRLLIEAYDSAQQTPVIASFPLIQMQNGDISQIGAQNNSAGSAPFGLEIRNAKADTPAPCLILVNQGRSQIDQITGWIMD